MKNVSLIIGKNEEAVEHFHMTERCLQFVGRGYDKVQILLRSAKILSSVSSPGDEQRLEMMYIYASALLINSRNIHRKFGLQDLGGGGEGGRGDLVTCT